MAKQDSIDGRGRAMQHEPAFAGAVSRGPADWWRGFVTGGATMWLVAAALLAGFARMTALIPVAEPLHSRMVGEANFIALKLFAIFASPAIIVLLVFGLWKGLRKR